MAPGMLNSMDQRDLRRVLIKQITLLKIRIAQRGWIVALITILYMLVTIFRGRGIYALG